MSDMTKRINPPEGGWKPSTYYIIEVACEKSDHTARSILYTGFGDDNNLEGTLESSCYIKVISELFVELDDKGPVSFIMPIKPQTEEREKIMKRRHKLIVGESSE